jgi:hypothetical protein
LTDAAGVLAFAHASAISEASADLPVVVHLRVSKPVLSLVCRLANWIAALSATRELFAHHLHA